MPQGKVQLRGLKSLEYRNIIISKAKIIEVYDRCKYSGNQNNLSLKSVKFADMPHEKIYNNFTGGLDTDSQENFVKPTDWRYALNIRAGVAYANREGAITNLKGNTEVAYALPSGTNTCIGAYEDKQENTVIYFIQNSNGNDQILRYFPDQARIDLQMEYDFGWAATTEITGIELINKRLLYWNDPKPRKINIEKARYILPDGTQKVKEWSLVLPKTISNLTAPYELYFKDENGTLIFGLVFDPASYANREEFIQAIAANLNLVSSQSPVTAEACDCSLNFTEKVGGTVWIIESNNPTIVIPTNWYGLTITDRMVDRAKYPPLNFPIAEYREDSDFLPNYVIDKVFQFRLQYNYDDFEESALGLISQIPINNLGCDGRGAPEYNYLNINFNDTELPIAETLTILKTVEVLVRENNDGNWRSVIKLEPCEYLDYDGTNWTYSFDFYNNINSQSVPDTEVAKQYDDVPLSAEENILVKNRSILANVVKGYDAPDCIPATYSIDFTENRLKPVYKVKFYLRVLTYGLSDQEQPQDPLSGNGRNFFEFFPTSLGFNKYPFWQHTNPDVNYVTQRGGIFRDITNDGTPFFGGAGFGAGGGGDFGIIDGMDTIYDQRIPEGGFTVYAAGTPFFGVSKQKNIGLDVDGNGALDISSDVQKDRIGAYLYQSSNNDLYHEVEILVPEGEYVFRVASHWCSFGDKIGKGFAYDLNGTLYQKTSTNVWGTYSQGSGVTPMYTANAFQKSYEIKLNVTSDINDAGTFLIMDISPPWDIDFSGEKIDNWRGISGYLVDSFGNVDINSPSFDGVTVEKTPVEYNGGTGWSGISMTDHNGYFFGILTTSFYNLLSITAYQINTQTIVSGAQTIYYGNLSEYYTKTLTPYVFDGIPPDTFLIQNELIYGFLPTDNVNARSICSTLISGTVENIVGAPINQALVVYENGRYDYTNEAGQYLFVVWGDMLTPNLGNFATIVNFTYGTDRTVDNLIFSIDAMCMPNYPNGQELFPITISPIGNNPSDYNPTNPYIANTFQIDEGNDPSFKTHKRGGLYSYVGRMYDELGRFCSCIPLFDIYIPFETEDIGLYDIQDSSGTTYPIGTYKYGKPIIGWDLPASTVFPSWVKYFQFLRTKNNIYGRYLQWVANEVTYLASVETDDVPEIQTSYLNSDATAIKISISNIVDYAARNSDSQVGYSFEEGDRIRIIADRNLNYYQGIYDFEVISYDSTTQSIIVKVSTFPFEIKSGSIFEIFNAQTINTNDGQIFYEVGEEIKVNNGIPSAYSGTFSNGDTYWRGRYIPVNDDSTNYAGIYPVAVEDASVSDFYPSNSQDIGRAGVVDPNFKQIHYPTMMQNSGIYVEGSALNGLSSFNTYDYKELNRAFGAIKRLFYVGNTLISIHENKVVANYIELRSLSDANTTDGLLAVSDAYFGNDRPMQSEYGCQHGKSAVQWNGLVYFLDAAKGVVCRYDNNGMDAISDKSMRSYFRDLCRDGVNKVRAVFDPYYRQYVVTIDAENGTKTIAWDEEKNRWTSEYSFIGEDYASVLRSIVSFKDGKLWLHDSNPIYNNFYGVQYSSQVKNVVVSGTNRSTYHTLTLQAVQADPLQNDWQALNITNEFNQQSRIKKPHFRLKENVWAASFLRDTTDTTVSNPIINGRNLRSQTLTILLDNDSTDAVYLQTVTTKVLPSERQ